MDPEKQERIAVRAYRIWEEAGRPHGRDTEHWHRAVAEIEAEDNAEHRPRQGPAEPASPELPPKTGRNRKPKSGTAAAKAAKTTSTPVRPTAKGSRSPKR